VQGNNGRVKRLNGMDAMLLYSETPNLHTRTWKIAIINAAGRRERPGPGRRAHRPRKRQHG
jgi:hypothetical protein